MREGVAADENAQVDGKTEFRDPMRYPFMAFMKKKFHKEKINAN